MSLLEKTGASRAALDKEIQRMVAEGWVVAYYRPNISAQLHRPRRLRRRDALFALTAPLWLPFLLSLVGSLAGISAISAFAQYIWTAPAATVIAFTLLLYLSRPAETRFVSALELE